MTRHNHERYSEQGQQNRRPISQQEHRDYNRAERGENYGYDSGRNPGDFMRRNEFGQHTGQPSYLENEHAGGRRMQTTDYGKDYQQGRNRTDYERADYERTQMQSPDVWSASYGSDSAGRNNYRQNDYRQNDFERGRGMQSGRDFQQDGQRGGYDRTGMDPQQEWRRYSDQSNDRLSSTVRGPEDEGFEGGQHNNWQNEQLSNQNTSKNQTSYVGKGPKNYKRRDDRIEEEINEELTRHHMIDATEIEVSVQDGEVTLKGIVDQRETKRLAEDIAESVSGVKDVRNEIKVQRQQTQQPESRESARETRKGEKERAA